MLSHDSSSKDRTSQDRAIENRSNWDKSSQDKSSQDRSTLDRSSWDRQVKSGKVVYLPSTLTWDCNEIKMKTYTWNSSLALLSPTCFFFLLFLLFTFFKYYLKGSNISYISSSSLVCGEKLPKSLLVSFFFPSLAQTATLTQLWSELVLMPIPHTHTTTPPPHHHTTTPPPTHPHTLGPPVPGG